jgi:hypothetical protein
LFREFCVSWDISERSNSEFVAFKNSPGIGVAVMLSLLYWQSSEFRPFLLRNPVVLEELKKSNHATKVGEGKGCPFGTRIIGNLESGISLTFVLMVVLPCCLLTGLYESNVSRCSSIARRTSRSCTLLQYDMTLHPLHFENERLGSGLVTCSSSGVKMIRVAKQLSQLILRVSPKQSSSKQST